MSNFILQRKGQGEISTWGDLYDPAGKHVCSVLERGLANPDHVRIPAGQYKIMLRPMGASHFDKTLNLIVPDYRGIPLLCDVPGRSGIEIHPANKVSELRGCLAPATHIQYLDDGEFDAVYSRDAFKVFYAALLGAMKHADASLVIKDIPTDGAIS
jgi:hypothetical protein